MSLYLGDQKLALSISHTYTNYITGTAMSDNDGVITFPKVDFTPIMIAIWNVVERDLKQEYIDSGQGEKWDESWVRYVQTGIMLFAIYCDGHWVSQGLTERSAGTYISNDSFSYGSCISVNDDIYSYRLARVPNSTMEGFEHEEDGPRDITNATFNYIIFG